MNFLDIKIKKHMGGVIVDLSVTEKLILCAVASNANIINYNDIEKFTKISKFTSRRDLQHLQDVGLLYRAKDFTLHINKNQLKVFDIDASDIDFYRKIRHILRVNSKATYERCVNGADKFDCHAEKLAFLVTFYAEKIGKKVYFLDMLQICNSDTSRKISYLKNSISRHNFLEILDDGEMRINKMPVL